jgi:site-specific recombinase XerC
MTDSFGASIEGYRDWLPYSGKRKGASTIRQYTRSAEQLAAWARELAVISVFLDAGVRIAEAAQLKVADVLVDDLRSRRLIVTGKGPKTRAVVIGSSTALALRKYLRWRAKSRYAGLEALWIGQRGRWASQAWTS